ncbi:hypothetical protein O6H91_Y568100 [Diphasiastrum complanatum]|nr:hypothetical protein O6H91_Y568100 [Diphasiastrum complanatum]
MPREFFDDFVKVAREEGRHFTMLAARLEQLEAFYGSFPVHDGLWDSAASTANDLSARLAIEHCVHEARGLDVMPTTVSRFRNGGDNATAELLESVVYPEEISHCAAGVKWFTFIWLRANLTSPSAPFTRINSNTERIIEETNTYQDCRHSGNEGSCEEKIVTQSGASVELNYTCDRNDGLDFLKSSFISQNVVPAFHAIVKKHFRGPLKPPFNEAARAKAGFGPEWYLPLSTRFSK